MSSKLKFTKLQNFIIEIYHACSPITCKQYGINLGHFMLMTWCVKIPLKCNINIGKKITFDELLCKNLRDSIFNSRFRFKREREANFFYNVTFEAA